VSCDVVCVCVGLAEVVLQEGARRGGNSLRLLMFTTVSVLSIKSVEVLMRGVVEAADVEVVVVGLRISELVAEVVDASPNDSGGCP